MSGTANAKDEELALRARDGSSAAFGVLYDRHAGNVARALASFAGPDRALLDDLVQDVFLRVIRGLPSYQPTHPFARWLSTIALNVGRNHARRQTRVVPVDPGEIEQLPGGYPADATLAAADLMRLVERLPVTMREVVALRAAWDMPYGEIAELLGIPEGTARSRMHNAVTILRERVNMGQRRRNGNHE